MRILLVEDTEDVAAAVVASFTRRGDAMDLVASVEAAEDSLAVQEYDCIILDIELPDGSGYEVLASLRARRKTTPVLMLTARTAIDERVSALDGGADDYLTKPFDLRELHARVRALTRRASAESAGRIEFGNLIFDPAGQALSIGGEPVTLTRREFTLLEVMLANRGRVIPKNRIFESMFAFDDDDVSVNTVEIHVSRLRRKLGGSSVSILTLRGLGYQLVAEG